MENKATGAQKKQGARRLPITPNSPHNQTRLGPNDFLYILSLVQQFLLRFRIVQPFPSFPLSFFVISNTIMSCVSE